MEKLPIEFKEKWIEALRSGKYKQTSSFLSQNGQYCCLGVACRMVGIKDEAMKDYGLIKDLEIDMDLPDLPEILVNDRSYNIVDYLTYMNDGIVHSEYNPTGKKHSFEQIADWIEQNL